MTMITIFLLQNYVKQSCSEFYVIRVVYACKDTYTCIRTYIYVYVASCFSYCMYRKTRLTDLRQWAAERVATETHLERSDFHFLLSIYMSHVSPTACTGRPGSPT